MINLNFKPNPRGNPSILLENRPRQKLPSEGEKAILGYKRIKYSQRSLIKAETKPAFWEHSEELNKNHSDQADWPPPPPPTPLLQWIWDFRGRKEALSCKFKIKQ